MCVCICVCVKGNTVRLWWSRTAHTAGRVGEVQEKGFLLELADSDQEWEELTFLFYIFPTQYHFLSFLSYQYAEAVKRRWSWCLGCTGHHTVEIQHSLVETCWHCLWTLTQGQLSLCCTHFWALRKKHKNIWKEEGLWKWDRMSVVAGFRDGPLCSCPLVFKSLFTLLPQRVPRWFVWPVEYGRNDGMSLSRLDFKWRCAFHVGWNTHSRRSQLPFLEDIQETYREAMCQGTNTSTNSHVSEPSWTRILQHQSSFRIVQLGP